MNTDEDNQVVLSTFANELEAAAAVTTLQALGVEALVMGGYISRLSRRGARRRPRRRPVSRSRSGARSAR